MAPPTSAEVLSDIVGLLYAEGVTYGYLFAVTSTPTPLELAKNPELVSEATLSVEDLGWAKWKVRD
jgi:hypothetical protein